MLHFIPYTVPNWTVSTSGSQPVVRGLPVIQPSARWSTGKA